MSEKGILFSTPMVKALIYDKCKTHTRRVAGLEKVNKNPDEWELKSFENGAFYFVTKDAGDLADVVACKPRYQVGDALWIRETWSPVYVSRSYECPSETCYFEWDDRCHGELEPNARGLRIFYKADENLPSEFDMGEIGWRSSMFMYKWAARPERLLVKSVGCHRVQDITEEQTIQEGFKRRGCYARDLFAATLEHLNPKSKPWSKNLWVFDYGFELIT